MARRITLAAVAVAVAVLALASGAASQGQAQAHAPAPAPGAAPAADCAAAVTGLLTCLPYVQPGSTQGKPTRECCAGVKAATRSPAAVACLCGAFGQYGAQVNLTRAVGLPAACGEDPTVFKACNIKLPTGSPASAPTAPGTAPAAPSPGSSKSAAVIRSPVSAFAVLAAVAVTLLSHCLL